MQTCLEHEDKISKELIQPILDVMSGADGGIAFAKLRFSLLPHIVARADVNDQKGIEALKAFEIVSNLCKSLLK